MNGPELLSLLDKAHQYGECCGQLEMIEKLVALFDKGGSRKQAMALMAKRSRDMQAKASSLLDALELIEAANQ